MGCVGFRDVHHGFASSAVSTPQSPRPIAASQAQQRAVRSERGFFGPAGHRPRVLCRTTLGAALRSAAALGGAALLATPRALAATLAAALGRGRLAGPRVIAAAAETATAATSAGHPGDLGRGVLQAGADLVDVELHDGALLALAGLVRARLETALRDDAHPLLQGLRDVLRCLAPDRAVEEQRVAVLPLVGLPVEVARRRGDREVRDGRTRRGEPELRVTGQVADNGDDGLASHGRSSWIGGRTTGRRISERRDG